ncbi:hypothetical protein 13AC503A_gene0040 [Aeromonas phage 13AC503A]|nr:hypothetical protein 13AC503A_gene0040 [Aeromonas phage 13AC503A]
MIHHTLNANAAAVIAAASKEAQARPTTQNNPGTCQQCHRLGVAVITSSGLCAQCSPQVFTRISTSL